MKSSELLDYILAGNELTVTDLDLLIVQRVGEDGNLDYKHGNLITNANSSDVIREYMAAFANSSGGVLIIGVDEQNGVPTNITGCPSNRGDLAGWASRCLTPISSQFSPIPKIHTVPHSAGEVLICAAARSLRLVSVTKGGKAIYYLRMHDQTLQAPDYLVSDLLVGHRQQPDLVVADSQVWSIQKRLDKDRDALDLELSLVFRLENLSFVWADEVNWGVILWSLSASAEGMNPGAIWPSPHLLSFVQVERTNLPSELNGMELRHIVGSSSLSIPFRPDSVSARIRLPLRIHSRWFSYTWKAALYLVSRGSLPRWYQIDLAVDGTLAERTGEELANYASSEKLRVTSLISEPAIVALAGL